MIMINLDVMMAKRKKGLTELAGEVDITLANLSILKNNKAKAVRLSTLNAICKALDCQPGDILQYVDDEEDVENEREKNIYMDISVVQAHSQNACDFHITAYYSGCNAHIPSPSGQCFPDGHIRRHLF